MSSRFAGFDLTDVAGVPVLWRRDLRFKTFRVTLHTRRPLDQRAAARALLPGVLLQGTAIDRDRPALARRMERLFGAAVIPSSGKLGESHVLRFSVDAVAGGHLPREPDVLGMGLAFLADFAVRPRLAAGDLPADLFARERRQAAHAARAIFNDKGHWAAQQALALACAGEPIAIPEHGGVEAIEALQPDDVEAARRDFLEHGQIWLVAHGALPARGTLDTIATFLAELPARTSQPIPDPVQCAPRPLRRDVERVDVQQAKLVLTYRLPWTTAPATWAARVAFASLLGGGPHSRLFREVRERHSLAYYAHAVLERNKGLLQVHVGLDVAAADRVHDEVERQVAALRGGAFTTAELDTARVGIVSSLAAVDDGIVERMEFTSRQWLHGHDRDPEQQAMLYQRLGVGDVAAAVDGLWLDHSYTLAPIGTP